LKFIRQYQDAFTFEISKREKSWLLNLLNLFPLVPLSHHQLSKSAKLPDQEANQRLLEESLQAQRDENRRLVAVMLSEENRFRPGPDGFRFDLTRAEIEWLLQVLNDVRLGCWLLLGSPDLAAEDSLELTLNNLPHIQRMELAGMFEMFLLSAINRAG
jgi:hypothetical protein